MLADFPFVFTDKCFTTFLMYNMSNINFNLFRVTMWANAKSAFMCNLLQYSMFQVVLPQQGQTPYGRSDTPRTTTKQRRTKP